ncbi:D-alanyl-lipoteichoic acid acyltransferase DltB (MBOAT superfamily) [Inquilinus ginsengisoli]|uniref:Probable alginate O-acetylase AlgI n=1 Tax=Inquilinus ginsengisoli TaxID=363840 RepID=A0ABU1JTK8_9PROT|nr:MBOAT family O-acyltransferase [Inquilinus ginsengisoli]MDR6290925.1 D-alanyl-lipoteichoic acid acyltransferase DltB (MBOAT superfamily) [Inquilinus ginsengisoli]
MLFNSYAFILLFLPLTYALWTVARRFAGVSWAIGVLLAASLVFYGASTRFEILLLLAAIVLNHRLGLVIYRHRETPRGRAWMRLAVAGNLLFLFVFKYTSFTSQLAAEALGWPGLAVHIALPVGISFYTFQQIAYLVDVARGQGEPWPLPRYALFVVFFPHLIAGPIVHHRELIPQFASGARMARIGDVVIGLSIFTIGLAKKVLVADSFALIASPVFNAVAQGTQPGLLDAWAAALAYALQIYFDFSAYSDMAIGLGRMFGIQMPINFASPYRSGSIVEFWRRWHITLSRFLRDYLYIPLGGNRHGPGRRYLNVFVTMLLGGIWHGAGFTFVIWGAMHGLLIVACQAWRSSRHHVPMPAALGWVLTMTTVVLAWVPFRAADFATAGRIYAAMFGMTGELHVAALDYAPSATLEIILTALLPGQAWNVWLSLGAGLAGLLACLCLPNVQTLFRRHGVGLPTHGYADGIEPPALGRLGLAWRPSPATAVLAGILLAACILNLNDVSEFIYFRF